MPWNIRTEQCHYTLNKTVPQNKSKCSCSPSDSSIEVQLEGQEMQHRKRETQGHGTVLLSEASLPNNSNAKTTIAQSVSKSQVQRKMDGHIR